MKNLTLAWTATADRRTRRGSGTGVRAAPPDDHRRRRRRRRLVGGRRTVKGAILSVNGVLYVTAPDNVWALDAHDGHELWHYFWRTRGGTHIGNRGVGDVGQLSVLRHARTTT